MTNPPLAAGRRRPPLTPRRGRSPDSADLNHLAAAKAALRKALRQLTAAGAHHAALATRRALKSVDGALRHATLVFHRVRPVPGTHAPRPSAAPTGRSFSLKEFNQVQTKILKLGSAAFVVDVAPGSTIQNALDSANLSTQGMSVSLNGLGASTETSISEGDVITLIPKVVGGAAA